MRPLSTAMTSALAQPQLNPAVFISMGFLSKTVYVWTGLGNVTWNGQTWMGAGSLMSLSLVEDASGVNAKGIQVTLSGLDPTLLPEAITDFGYALPVRVWLALYGNDGSLIADPVVAWAGRMDKPTVDVSADDATITFNAESKLISMNIPCSRRHTCEDQALVQPGDEGLKFVNGLQECNLTWGSFPVTGRNI